MNKTKKRINKFIKVYSGELEHEIDAKFGSEVIPIRPLFIDTCDQFGNYKTITIDQNQN